MRMDTETISYVLEGHELQNDVQTMIQVFLANRHYIRTDTVTDAEITVKSEMKEGIASAMLYRRGEKASAWSMEYDEKMLTEKEQKRIIKRTIYELLKAETGIRPQWGLLTGVRPAKLISSLLEEGKTDKECLAFLTEDYLVMPHKAALALKVAKAERRITALRKSACISGFPSVQPDVCTAPLRRIRSISIKIGWMNIWMPCSENWIGLRHTAEAS